MIENLHCDLIIGDYMIEKSRLGGHFDGDIVRILNGNKFDNAALKKHRRVAHFRAVVSNNKKADHDNLQAHVCIGHYRCARAYS